MTRKKIVIALAAYGEATSPDTSIAHTAILIGALDRPTLPLARYHRHLEMLSKKVGDFARINNGPVPVSLMHNALQQVMVRHHGYGGGDTEGTDEDCFDLTRVIDARNGSTEALTILYAEIARCIGWSAEIILASPRLLLRLEADGERLIIDPIDDCRILEPADIRAIIKAFGGNEVELTPNSLSPLDDKEALLRLMAGRKSVLLSTKRLEEAASLLDIALRIAPEEPSLWRECGLLNARLDNVQLAVDALEEYLRLGTGEASRYNTTILLQELRGRLT